MNIASKKSLKGSITTKEKISGFVNVASGGGGVESVNGKTGAVVLTAEDLGAISQDDLQAATNEALAQAKASGAFDGKTGPQGPAGADGATGASGADGKSAYQIAVENGFSGTEAEWLASLKGPIGETGPQGIQGIQGPQGERGADADPAQFNETDPTVPSWAKESTKPTYTADEVGAATIEQFNQLSEAIADQQDVIDSSVLFTAQTLTEVQKAQARANIGATAGEELEFADSVEWLDENGDTSKKYVLPDGYIYTWQYKNETIEHNANDGTGLLNQYPQGTWGNTYGSKNGVWSSPLIRIDPSVMAPVDARNDTLITISGLDKIVPVYNNASIWTYYYKSDGSQMFAQNGANMGGIGTNSEITLPLSYQLKNGNHFLDSNWAQVAGVRICIGISTAGAITSDDIKNLKVNIPFFNAEIDGYGWYSTGQQHSNDKATQQNSADIATLKEEVADLKEAVQKSPSASGAVWYAIGDSITYGLYSTSATEYFQPVVGQRWVDYVAQYNGYELTNLGKSNAGFLTSPTFRSMVDSADFANADLVTIMLGVNDWKYEGAVDKVGTMDDDISTGGTIVSELRYGLEKIIADNPYCKIILITPINAKIGGRGTEATNWAYGYSGTSTPTPCGSLKNFGDKLKEVCEYYGIQVVDMTNSSVVNRKSITTVLPDGIHPNLECYKALGLELARRITFA